MHHEVEKCWLYHGAVVELSEWPEGQMAFIRGIWWLMHSNNLQFSAAVLLSAGITLQR